MQRLRQALWSLYPEGWEGEKGFQLKAIEVKLPFEGENLRRMLRGLSSKYESEITYESRFGLDTVYLHPPNPYSIWDMSRTDMPFYDNLLKNPEYYRKAKDIEGSIVWCSPENYMRMASQVHGVTVADEYNALVGKVVNQYAHSMERGEKFPLPVISYAFGGEEEGRHRVAAAQTLGHKLVPVLVVKRIELGG